MMNTKVTWLAIVLFGVCGCSEHQIKKVSSSEDAHIEGPTRSDEIRGQDLSGEVVTIRGFIDGVYGQRAFAVKAEESKLGPKDKQILIVAQVAMEPAQKALASRDDVIVRGTLRKFDRSALHQELGWNPLSLESDYDGEMVVVADSVTMAENPLFFWNKPLSGYKATP